MIIDDIDQIKREIWQGSRDEALRLIEMFVSSNPNSSKLFYDWKDPAGNGLICAALHKEDPLELLKVLLDVGCDPNSRCGARLPISFLVDEGSEHGRTYIDEVILLLKNGAVPNMRAGAGMTVLHHAVDCRRYSLVEALLQYGGDPDIDLESDGETARKSALSDPVMAVLLEKYEK